MSTRSWLVSAFNPFLDRDSNHSMTVLERILSLNRDPGLNLYSVILPTEYDRCEQVLLGEIFKLKEQKIELSGVLSLGEGNEDFKIETQANNMDHAPQSADNAGVVRVQQRIFADREAIIPLDFPVEKFPIKTSMNAGFFVCNHLCARMSVARKKDPLIPYFGFIHVPRSDLAQRFTTEHCATAILTGLRALALVKT